jgi:sugar phosphate isomerase/epimerase
MDQHKLRTLVFEKTGVKIDVDDPVFALVALNEAVLAEAVERHVALLHEANAELGAQVATLQGRPPAAPRPAAPTQPSTRAADARAASIAAGAAVLGAALVLAGQAILFKPAPPPAPVVQAKALTPEQSAALQNADKLARIVDKLDRKTRAAIAAEMQKP